MMKMNRTQFALTTAATALLAFMPACAGPIVSPIDLGAPAGGASFPAGEFMMMDGFGYWHFAFAPGDTFAVTLNDLNPVVRKGRYSVAGDRVTFSDDSDVCEGKGDGVYSWRFDGEVLALRTIEDRCTLWRFALTKRLVPISAQTLDQHLPPGRYTALMQLSDVSGYPQLAGVWEWRIAGDGRFQLSRNGELVQQGTHFTLGNKARFIADVEAFPCFMPNSRDPLQQPDAFLPGAMKTAVYQWKITGGALSLEQGHDWCHGRRALLTSFVWARSDLESVKSAG